MIDCHACSMAPGEACRYHQLAEYAPTLFAAMEAAEEKFACRTEGGAEVGARLECCEAMKRAQEGGTDNEGYGSAVWEERGPTRVIWAAGSGLPDISLCPWCGERGREAL